MGGNSNLCDAVYNHILCTVSCRYYIQSSNEKLTRYEGVFLAEVAAADATSVFVALGGILMNELVYIIKTRASSVMMKMGRELVFGY